MVPPFRILLGFAIASGLVAATTRPATGQSRMSEAQVDEYVRRQMDLRHIPGLSVAVVRDGRVVMAKGYGIASVEFQVPATADTRYLLASLTKQFTATAVMMLVEEGKIRLDDPISRYLDDPPAAWDRITVRHLLTHTAGLKHRFEGRAPNEWLLTFSKAALYGSAKSLPLDFKPGEQWQYSDQGYFLLGLVVERAAGRPYATFMADRIFKSLGMTSTVVLSKTAIIPNLAPNYSRLGTAWIRSRERDADYGVGSHYGIVSTVNDLVKWNAALDAHSLIPKGVLEQMWTPATLASGEVADSGIGGYGFGWFLDEFRGHGIVMHGGSTGTCMVRYPDDRLAVIVLSNLEGAAGMDADAMALRIAGMFLPAVSWDAMRPAPDPEPAATQLFRQDLDAMISGKPDMSRFTKDAEPYARAAARSFSAAGGPRVFTNLKLAFLAREQQAARRVLYYLATSDAASMYLRVTIAADGRIARLQITQQ
jgi:CubicO group peptidase (beta-lactamase class C family)